MSISVWENGRIVSKPDAFVKTGNGPVSIRRFRDPLARALSKRQINAALILAGISEPDAFIEDAAAAISDETERALAVNDWRYATRFDRSHVLFTDAGVLKRIKKTSAEMDAIWLAAAEQPR